MRYLPLPVTNGGSKAYSNPRFTDKKSNLILHELSTCWDGRPFGTI